MSALSAETSVAAAKKPDYGEFVAHPAADVFPLMRKEDLQRLADDIKEHGQLDDIEILAGTKQIVDGRNRYLACRRADVEPRTAEVSTDGMPYGVYEYVVSKNLLRRQLTAAQRQAVVKKLRESGQSIRAIAETTGIPRATVARDVKELAQSGHLDQPERIEGKDGRSRPAAMPPKAEIADETPDAPKQPLDAQDVEIRFGRILSDLQDILEGDISAGPWADSGLFRMLTIIAKYGKKVGSPESVIPADGKPSAKVVNDWLRSVGRESEVTRGKVSNALIAEYLAAHSS